MTAPHERCGEGCERAEGVFTKVADKSSDVFSFATANVFESIVVDGSDIAIAQQFNVSSVPAIMMFQVGLKTYETAIKVEGQAAAHLLSSPKLMFTQFSQFVPSMVQRVTQHSLKRFLTEVRRSGTAGGGGVGVSLQGCACHQRAPRPAVV